VTQVTRPLLIHVNISSANYAGKGTHKSTFDFIKHKKKSCCPKRERKITDSEIIFFLFQEKKETRRKKTATRNHQMVFVFE